MSFNGMLNKTCTIEVATYAQDDNQEQVPTWATYKANEPFMLTGSKGGRQDFKADIVETMTHVGFLNFDAAITIKSHRIVMGANIFTIMDICNPRTDNHHLELALQQIK